MNPAGDSIHRLCLRNLTVIQMPAISQIHSDSAQISQIQADLAKCSQPDSAKYPGQIQPASARSKPSAASHIQPDSASRHSQMRQARHSQIKPDPASDWSTSGVGGYTVGAMLKQEGTGVGTATVQGCKQLALKLGGSTSED